MRRLEHSQLRDGYLEVSQHLQQKTLEFLIGAVQLIYQQHRSAVVGRVYGLKQGPLDEEALAEQPRRGRLTVNVAAGLHQPYFQQLTRMVPLVNGVVYVQPLIALQADERGVQGRG